MEVVLGKVTQHAMNYAIRSGIAITANYAFRQSSRLIKTVEGNERHELQTLQERLKGKIDIISPAIDMIELISARGNTSLESAVTLTKSLRWEIQNLGQRIASAANDEEILQRGASKAKPKTQTDFVIKRIISDIKTLLERIEDAVPLINLAITTSGANLSTNLPATVSPSRLLQASTFLTAGDNQYATAGSRCVQVGPTFTLSLYMLFSGHVRLQTEEEVRASTWKEVIHKAKLKLMRVPLDDLHRIPDPASSFSFGSSLTGSEFPYHHSNSNLPAEVRADEFAYQIVLVEDLDDDRVHTYEDEDLQPGSFGDVVLAGIREAIPVHEISKIFYADTGKILNIGSEVESSSPILLVKRDLNAFPPRRMMERSATGQADDMVEGHPDQEETPTTDKFYDDQSEIDAQLQRESRSSSMVPPSPSKVSQNSELWRIPHDLDPEWLAFEVYTEDSKDEEESEDEPSATISSPSPRPATPLSTSGEQSLTSALAQLNLSQSPIPRNTTPDLEIQSPMRTVPAVVTSLSLLETLLRLLSLQQFQQMSHLAIPDELLNFFLSEAATTGAATGDESTRRRLRNEARQRVGFDPYDESPIKRRGEDYQYRGGASQQGDNEAWNGSQGERYEWEDGSYDEGYGTHQFSESPSARTNKTWNSPLRPVASPGSPRSSGDAERRRSRQTTPDSGMPVTPPSPLRNGARRVKGLEHDGIQSVRKGSPLAGPPIAVRDDENPSPIDTIENT